MTVTRRAKSRSPLLTYGPAARVVALAAFWLASCLLVRADILLRFVVFDGDEGLKAMRPVLHDFEVAHPGVKVKLENVEFNTYFQKLLAQYAADVAPDVAMMDPGHFQAFAKRGALNPLNQYFSVVPGFNIRDYYDQIVKAHSYKGELFVLPRDIAPMGLIYYNKKAFDEAGIPYPDGSWTWDFNIRPEFKEKDFLWVLQQLTKKDAKGQVTRWAFIPSWTTLLADTFTYSQGVRYVDDPEKPSKLFYNDPRTIKAYQLTADLCLKYKFMPSTNDLNTSLQATGWQLFASQKVAMYQCGIWDSESIRRALKPGTEQFFDWDITLAPGYKDGVKAAPTGGSGYAMLSSTPHPKEAWELIQWMAGEHGMVAMAKSGSAQPAIHKLAMSSAWIPGPNTPIAEQYPKSRILTDTAVQYVVFGASSDSWPEIDDLIKPHFDPIFLGTGTAEEQLKLGQSIAEKRLQAILKQKEAPRFNWTGGIVFGAGLILALIGWVFYPERKKKLSRQERTENRMGFLFMSPGLLGILFFSLGPMVISLLMSLADWDIIRPAQWRGLGNYSEAFFEDSRFWKCLEVTGIYTLIAVPLGLVGALALALLLNTKVRGMTLYRTCFYLPALASVVASSLIWKRVFQPDGGLLNAVIYGSDGHRNLLGIGSLLTSITGKAEPANWLGSEKLAMPSIAIMSLWGLGAGMIILLAGLQGVPQYYYEAATLDGAGAWRRFRHVTLPMIAPSLFFVSVTGVIGGLQVFTQAFVITQGGPNDSTRFFMYHLYDQAFRNLRMGYASALAWLLFLVILVMTLIQFKLNRKIYYEAELR